MRKLVKMLASLAFAVVLLELAGFLYFNLADVRPISHYGYPVELFVEHPVLDYLYRPSFSGAFDGAAYQHVSLEINEHGFRDRSFAGLPREARRVLVIGDSVVMGPGVRAQERFTTCLQDGPTPLPGENALLNLGVNGYGFEHYATLAELDYLGIERDFVLVGITLNDFESKERSEHARRVRLRREQPGERAGARRRDRMARTYAVRLLEELGARLRYARMNADEDEAYHTKWMRSVVRAWSQPENRQRFAGALDRFRRRMDDSGLPYAFVLFPERNDLLNPEEFSAPRATVREILAERQLDYCDAYPDFRQSDDPAALFLPHDSVHFDAAGHELLCAAIARCVERGDLHLPNRRTR